MIRGTRNPSGRSFGASARSNYSLAHYALEHGLSISMLVPGSHATHRLLRDDDRGVKREGRAQELIDLLGPGC